MAIFREPCRVGGLAPGSAQLYTGITIKSEKGGLLMASKNGFWGFSLCALALVGLPLAALSAGFESHSLEVHVLDRQNGNAIESAAVCLGTAAKTDQFGALRTNADGIARFEDLPPNSLLVTVSKRGLQGNQQLLEPMSQHRVIVLKVAAGGGGPQCDAPASAPVAGAASSLKIDRVKISEESNDSSSDQISVSVKVSRMANQVRISESADFAGAQWQEFRSPLTFKVAPGKGVKQLYVQVRHHVQTEGAVIEVVSPVKQVRFRRY